MCLDVLVDTENEARQFRPGFQDLRPTGTCTAWSLFINFLLRLKTHQSSIALQRRCHICFLRPQCPQSVAKRERRRTENPKFWDFRVVTLCLYSLLLKHRIVSKISESDTTYSSMKRVRSTFLSGYAGFQWGQKPISARAHAEAKHQLQCCIEVVMDFSFF